MLFVKLSKMPDLNLLDEVKIYQGPNSVDMFMDDMLQTAQEKRGDIISVFKAPEMMMRLFSSINNDNAQRLKQLANIVGVKSLLSETLQSFSIVPWLQCRTIPKHNLGPTPYIVCGDKHALILEEGGAAFRFVVFNLGSLAQSYREHFCLLWNEATPLPIQETAAGKRRVKA
jgi:hypothetical protein